MIRPISGPARPRHLAYSLCVVALMSLAWYAVQPVYQDCVYISFEPMSHEEAIDAGLCPPPEMRWETWTN